MTQPFNKLTPAKIERLALLSEEAGEVQQTIGKILRHGYEETHPDNTRETNRQALEREIGDFTAIIQIMMNSKDLNLDNIKKARMAKIGRIVRYLHHQEDEDGWLTLLS